MTVPGGILATCRPLNKPPHHTSETASVSHSDIHLSNKTRKTVYNKRCVRTCAVVDVHGRGGYGYGLGGAGQAGLGGGRAVQGAGGGAVHVVLTLTSLSLLVLSRTPPALKSNKRVIVNNKHKHRVIINNIHKHTVIHKHSSLILRQRYQNAP